jgi:hypothetical protein
MMSLQVGACNLLLYLLPRGRDVIDLCLKVLLATGNNIILYATAALFILELIQLELSVRAAALFSMLRSSG